MSLLRRHSGFKVIGHTVKWVSIDQLNEIWIQRWPTVNKLEMPAIPWLKDDEGIQRLGGN